MDEPDASLRVPGVPTIMELAVGPAAADTACQCCGIVTAGGVHAVRVSVPHAATARETINKAGVVNRDIDFDLPGRRETVRVDTACSERGNIFIRGSVLPPGAGVRPDAPGNNRTRRPRVRHWRMP
ncbi:hypothetical protein Bpla01_37850 [Burkholderia plantarii]|nr:hypothetical protein Bpla01_37850 [Burkholderia plantarii]